MKLGIIGVGNMANAIVDGALANGIFKADDISLYDINPYKLSPYTEKGMHAASDHKELAQQADLILMAVKPQQVDDALDSIKGYTDRKCIVSIVAGVSISYYKEKLGEQTYVVRVMPNTPMMLGCGATAVARDSEVSDALFDRAVSLFSCSGEVAFIDESLMNAIIGVNGSSPAYFFVMADAIVKTAEEQGIDPSVALRLAAKTMEGAAAMLLKSGKTPAELTAQVTSKGGTTLAALAEMDRLGFSDAIRGGMLACTKRAAEIGR